MLNNLGDRANRIKADDETIDVLLSHGADLQQEYLIDFLFLGGRDKLMKLENELLRQGYVKHPVQRDDSSLLVERNIRLENMQSHLITESLQNLASEFGLVFDGWGTTVKKK